MKKKIAGIKVAVLLGISALLFVMICSSKKMNMEKTHRCATTNQTFQTDVITENDTVVQKFVPACSELKSVIIRINKLNDGEGKIRIVLYDADDTASGVPFTVYASAERNLNEIHSGEWEEFILDAKLQPGKNYYFSVGVSEESEAGITIDYRPLQLDRIDENQQMFYNSVEIAGASMACGYIYRLPLTKLQMITYAVFCVFIVFLADNLIHIMINSARNRHAKSKI